MRLPYYGPLLALAASLPLVLAGCSSGSGRSADVFSGVGTVQRPVQQAKADDDNTDETLWTWIGLAKRDKEREIGPHTGRSVSPELWQAALDTLKFAGTSAEDPSTGLIMTKWYSPPNKLDERLRVSVFILSRALRSDSVTLTIEREVRTPTGGWQKAPVAREVVDGLDSAILQRAQQIHSARYRSSTYN